MIQLIIILTSCIFVILLVINYRTNKTHQENENCKFKQLEKNIFRKIEEDAEQNNKLSKESIRLGYIGLFITVILSFEYIKNFVLKFFE
ncbi:hypothetical protein [Aliarcobacter butzleri]|uniref:hypothetical protein n=1 Tax=Aliarcobacter butzleri TaxID=28197 RepID=UPI00263CF948|nr:hypothetical protein [Aliarcobacter butzleri]MDN5053821.1 hypothetical protein [Aliarcobacter butzleri]